MKQPSLEYYGRFQINPHDRITIGGKAMRLVHQTENGFVLRNVDDFGLAETFEFDELRRLSGCGKIQHEPDFYAPEHARRRLSVPVSRISDLNPKQRKRLHNRQAYVLAFMEMQAEGLVAANDPSIEANMAEICSRGLPFLREIAPDLETIQRENEIRNGQRRRVPGGSTKPSLCRVHPRTLRKWVSVYHEYGVHGLADSISQRGNRSSYFSAEERTLLMQTVKSSYLSPNRPSQMNTFQDVRSAFFAENNRRQDSGLTALKIPSREAVRGAINNLDKFEVVLSREGLQQAQKLFRPVVGGLEVDRPYERIEIDEWKVDLITLMADGGLLGLFTQEELADFGLDNTKDRWWFTGAIDCRTRCIVGMSLTRNPKASSALDCLQMTMLDKGNWADSVGAVSGWHMAATPEMVVTDNGSAFKAGAFTDSCAELGITLERTIAGAPGMRGTVERLFRTVSTGLLQRLNGRTFSSVVERGEHPSEGRACLSTEDLCFALVRWIVDIYHNTPHTGLGGKTPLEQWKADHDDGNHPLRAAPHQKSQRLAFGTHLTRTIRKDGVTVLGVRYHIDALATNFNQVGNREIEVRWFPNDIGSIEVRLEGAWHTVKASHDGFSGVHAQVWMEARRSLRTKDPVALKWRDSAVFNAVEAINTMNLNRSLEFGLITQNWSSDRIKQVEQSMFTGFDISVSKNIENQSVDGHGQVLEPIEPEQPAEPTQAVIQGPAGARRQSTWKITKGNK